MTDKIGDWQAREAIFERARQFLAGQGIAQEQIDFGLQLIASPTAAAKEFMDGLNSTEREVIETGAMAEAFG